MHIAENAPVDQPIDLTTEAERDRFFAMMEPCRMRAHAAWPDARRRFAAGLPGRHTMFVTTRLRDPQGRVEQVFVAVTAIDSGRISGRLWNDIRVVSGYQRGQAVAVRESDMVDWMIARPNGTEEGNWMGRYADALQATGLAPTGICDP